MTAAVVTPEQAGRLPL